MGCRFHNLLLILRNHMKRWVKEIFAINTIIGFSPHSCWAISTSKEKTVNINVDEFILNFCTFNTKEVIEYTPDEIEFSYIS